MRSDPNSEVEFEIGLVWDGVLLWYIKPKGTGHFKNVLIGSQRKFQIALKGSIEHSVISAKDWEEGSLLRGSPFSHARDICK